jgi:hypothetical protein
MTLRKVLEDKGAGPDFSYIGTPHPEELDFIHRRTAGEDIYFIWNKQKERIHIQATFRVKGRKAEIWDPLTGQMHKHVLYKETEKGTTLPLYMEPDGSLFVVFTSEPASTRFDDVEYSGINPREAVVFGPEYRSCNDTTWLILEEQGIYSYTRSGEVVGDYQVKELSRPVEIKGPWTVKFQVQRGAPDQVTMEELMNWADAKDEGVRYFSGLATYEKEFEVSKDWLGEDAVISLDLGKVEVMAEVFVNGRSAGILWTQPFKADITKLVQPGTNNLSIRVANLWPNRLIGDAKLPADQRVTKTSVIRLPNAWHFLMKDLPNEEYGLLDSGLLGPVRLVFGRKVAL